jgi:hypothetical protein
MMACASIAMAISCSETFAPVTVVVLVFILSLMVTSCC